jgi:Icc-related predicted phosphoesterase
LEPEDQTLGNTRIYYCCDVHGSDVCFRKALNIARYGLYKANIIIVGGDLTGKMIVPIVKQRNGSCTCTFLETTRLLKSEKEVAEMQKAIADAGFYPYIGEPEQIEDLKKDRPKFNALINELIIARMQEWMQIADERLASLSVQFFTLPGNDDNPKCGEIISASRHVKNPDGKVVNIDGFHEMISSGASNITPWKTPGDYPEEELEKRLEAMMSAVKNPSNCILNLHVPPYDSGLDVAPRLDEDLKPVLVGGEVMRIPVGSTAVRKIIEEHQPKLGLFGHIHESGGETCIGRTLCVNPGSEYSEGILRGYVVELDEKGIRQFYRVEG